MTLPTIPRTISSDQYKAGEQLTPLFQHLLDNGHTAEGITTAINDKKFRLDLRKDGSLFEVQVSPRSIYTAFEWVKKALAALPTEAPSFDDTAEVIDITTRKPITTTPATTTPMVTLAQRKLIARLIGQGRHLEGGYAAGPTTEEGIARMTRQGASAYIDSLTGRY